jgi:carboxymethylenebutenolidase
MTDAMHENVEGVVEDYRKRVLNRREFLARLITVTGSMAAAHMVLESSGLAATLVSDVESNDVKVSSSTIEYTVENSTPVSAYLSVPQGDGPFPAVVVIHENRGLNEHTRDVARRFAAEGFVALAPDALSRKGGTGSMKSPDEARAAIMSLPAEAALTDLDAGLRFLNTHPKVKPGQLGSVGFCWGGARSFALATQSSLLRASVVFYGSTPPLEQLPQVKCPVLGLYGDTDTRITSRVPETVAAMKEAGKRFEYQVYLGAGHAFFNDTGQNYNPGAARDAWKRTISFFRKHLREAESSA